MLLCDDIIHNRGKIILPHFNTYSTYHLSAGGPGRRALDQWLPKVHPQNNCLQVTWGKKKLYFYHTDSWTPLQGWGVRHENCYFWKTSQRVFMSSQLEELWFQARTRQIKLSLNNDRNPGTVWQLLMWGIKKLLGAFKQLLESNDLRASAEEP